MHARGRNDARLDRLERFLGLEPLPWPPADEPPALPLIGAAAESIADFDELEALCSAALGRDVIVPVRRSFDSASQWDVRRMAAGRVAGDIAAGRLSVVSWTTYPDAADLEVIRSTTPAGHRLSICCKHEVDTGKAEPAEHAVQMLRITETVRSWGRPEITTRVTFTGYGGRDASGQRARRWLDAGVADAVDAVSVDVYNTYGYPASDPDPGEWIDPDELLGPWLELGDEYGFRDRMAIDEHSCPEYVSDPPDSPGDVQRKVESTRRLVEIADAEGFGWVCYFDNEHGEISDGPDHRIKSSAEHLELFAVYAARAARTVPA